MEKTDTSIRIVVPVHNGEEHLSKVLVPVLAELKPVDSLVVVDDRSTDESALVAEECGAVLIPSKGRPGAAGARNTGASGAKEEWILFLDSDVIVPQGWREKLEVLMKKKIDAIQAVYGPDICGNSAATFYKNFYYHYTFTERIGGPYIRGCGTFFFAVRQEAFFKLSGFDDMIKGASIEDADFAARFTAAGYRILLAPSFEVLHLREYTLMDLLRYDWKMMKSKAMYLLRRDSGHDTPSISMASPGEMLPTISGAVGAWALVCGIGAFALGWNPGLPIAGIGLSVLLTGHVKFWLSSIRQGGWRGLLACIITVPDLLLIAPAVICATFNHLTGRKY